MTRLPVLNDKEIRTQYFVIPPMIIEQMVRPLMGDEYVDRILSQIRSASAFGVTELIGWPDGTTVVWTRIGDAIDLDKLAVTYKLARRMEDARRRAA